MCKLYSCCFMFLIIFFFFKQKTAYEMRISDWSSDVCSSDLAFKVILGEAPFGPGGDGPGVIASRFAAGRQRDGGRDRKSVVWGKSVSVRVDLGGRRIIKKKKQQKQILI